MAAQTDSEILKGLVRLVAAALLTELHSLATPPEWVDQKSASRWLPITVTCYLNAAHRGAFSSRRVGKRLVARRRDVEAWIEGLPTGARPVRPKASRIERTERDELEIEARAVVAAEQARAKKAKKRRVG